MSSPLSINARRIGRYAVHHKAGYILSVLCFLGASALEPLIPAMLGKVLNEGFAQNPSFPLWTVPVGLILLFMVRGLLGYCAQYAMAWANSRTTLDIRRDLVEALIRADAKMFHEFSPGVAVTKVINDPSNAIGQLGSALTTLLRDGTYALVMVGYLLYLNPVLTLLSFVTLPVMAVVIRRLHKRIQTVGGTFYQSQLRLVSVVDDIARAWRVVRTFDAGRFEQDRFHQEALRNQRTAVKSASASSMLTPVSQTISSFGIAAILTLALLQARADTTSVGEFVTFITALMLLVSRVRHLTEVSNPITGGLITAGGFFTLMDAPPEPDDGVIELDRAAGSLHLGDVVLRYSNSESAALDHLSLSVPAGQTIALVGSSGAGKTTVVNMLLGFLAPTSGSVLLDGHPIQSLTKASLRRQFAVVSQDIVLFEGTIAANVVYAAVPDEARIEACLRAANLWQFVQTLPDGVHTQIGTNGERLSGGQRQRLAIARAIYKDAPIWIFDEATSALDTESERVVQQAIDEWQGRKTMILIAHRLSTVRNADCIHVLENGRIIESGHHAELMTQGGVYAMMVRTQNRE